jgi:RNA-binding protein YhbY
MLGWFGSSSLHSLLNINKALSLSEDEALLQEASLDMFESESSSGPTLPKLDSTPMVAYDNLKEEEEDLEQTKEVASASAAEEAEDLIPVDEVQEHASPAVEDALVEDQDRDTASTGDEDVAIVEEEEEELVLEEGEGSSGFLLTSLPKAGKLWSLVPKATLRVGKAGITEQVLQQLRDQLHESEEGLVKVQLFNKQLEPLDVANEIMQRMVDEDVIVAESKGRTLLFTMA